MFTKESQMICSHGQSAPWTQATSWPAIDWKRCRRVVASLQARIVKAWKAGKYHKAKALQWLLTHSFSAKALAVRRVTENRGKKTPGVDGVIWDTPDKKWQATQRLTRHGYRASPSRRTYIPKANGQRRPLGIPVMHDRAMEAIHKQALEPIAETTADRHSYGFRPERSCADAISQCHIVLAGTSRAEWILEADIRGCFDHISHQWLLTSIPMDTTLLRQWLKAGVLEDGRFSATEEGTPQGGIISPVLMNMTLDGLDAALSRALGIKRNSEGKIVANPDKINLIRYADDFMITGISREILEEQVKPLLIAFLAERRLTLSEEKTSITHVEEGFDFLGQHIRKYRGKVIITPSKKNVKAMLTKVRQTLTDLSTAKATTVITQLNPIIRGWTNYHRHICAKQTFIRVDGAIHCALWRWARRRHKKQSVRWIRKKYWKAIERRHSVFAGSVDGTLIPLRKASDTTIRRHAKIESIRNPYDPVDRTYFATRHQKQMKRSLTPGRRAIWRQQEGMCPVCQEPISDKREWELHHKDGNHENNQRTNLVFLHNNCHRQEHARGRGNYAASHRRRSEELEP